MACFILSIVFLILLLFYGSTCEGFATRRDKAEAIYKNMEGQSEPMYNDYKKAMGGQSNIVEFEDMLALKRANDFTISSIERRI